MYVLGAARAARLGASVRFGGGGGASSIETSSLSSLSLSTFFAGAFFAGAAFAFEAWLIPDVFRAVGFLTAAGALSKKSVRDLPLDEAFLDGGFGTDSSSESSLTAFFFFAGLTGTSESESSTAGLYRLSALH